MFSIWYRWLPQLFTKAVTTTTVNVTRRYPQPRSNHTGFVKVVDTDPTHQ